MIVLRTARIESAPARGARRAALKILRYRKLVAARTAQNCFGVTLTGGPNFSIVIGDRLVTFKARKPMAAAFEFYRDYIEFAVPVGAPGLLINVYTEHFIAVNHPHTFCAAHSIR
jgi:hypothetical protein